MTHIQKSLIINVLCLILTACGGGGGGGSSAPATNQTVTTTTTTTLAPTPIAVQRTSYLNAKNINMVGQAIPVLTSPESITSAVAYADFFQDGTMSMVAFSNNFTTMPATSAGKAYFFKNVNGTWVDHTSDLISVTTGCISPRKVIVADFNGDGKPDIFVACHGVDVSPYSGEVPRILMSQPNGTYTNVAAPMTCFCHSATAADFSNNGYADIIVTDTSVHNTPFFLINNHNGTFTPDFTRMPNSVVNQPIYSAELIDFSGTGHYDLFLAGNNGTTGAQWPETIFNNPGNPGTADFHITTSTVLPAMQAYGMTLDIVFTNGSIYLNRTDIGATNYTSAVIQKITYPALASSTLFSSTTMYPNGTQWIDWIKPQGSNIISIRSVFGLSVAQ